MKHSIDCARESLTALLSDVLSFERFKHWEAGLPSLAATVLRRYTFGEIFWKKELGRPKTANLADGFTVEAWHDELVLVGNVGGAAEWVPLQLPYQASWWDGADDAKYFRVAYMIPGMSSGVTMDKDRDHFSYSHIVPHVNSEILWSDPGGWLGIASAGLRTFVPTSATFVKEDRPAYVSFEVVKKSLFVNS